MDQPKTTSSFHAGYCHECGAGYLIASGGATGSRYCSRRCARRVQRRARRAREHGASGSFTWDAFTKLALSLGNVCAYCGQGNNGRPLEPDHVLPLNLGGHDGITNILPCCRPCNSTKGDRTPRQWMTYCKRRGTPVDLAAYRHLTAHVFLDRPRVVSRSVTEWRDGVGSDPLDQDQRGTVGRWLAAQTPESTPHARGR